MWFGLLAGQLVSLIVMFVCGVVALVLVKLLRRLDKEGR
jgi:hypothetical protein